MHNFISKSLENECTLLSGEQILNYTLMVSTRGSNSVSVIAGNECRDGLCSTHTWLTKSALTYRLSVYAENVFGASDVYDFPRGIGMTIVFSIPTGGIITGYALITHTIH